MKRVPATPAIVTALLLITNPVGAQKLITVKGMPGLYYKSVEDISKQQDSTLRFFNFTGGETIGSIGAQSCNWEAAYATLTDSVFFYFEDIDTVYCNQKQAAAAWQYYGKLKGTPITSGYTIVTGDEKTTHLPPASCNKVLIINSFHEFTYPAEMLHDIATKLKPGGILFIDETLARYSGELHPVCKKRIFMVQELIDLLQANGFTCKKTLSLSYRKNAPSRQIFAFTLVGG